MLALGGELLFQGCGGLHSINEKVVKARRKLDWGQEEVGGRINAWEGSSAKLRVLGT